MLRFWGLQAETLVFIGNLGETYVMGHSLHVLPVYFKLGIATSPFLADKIWIFN